MLSSYPEYDSYAPSDYDGDPQYIHIDEYQDALGEVQSLKDNLKFEMWTLKKLLDEGDRKAIDLHIEDIYGYLED